MNAQRCGNYMLHEFLNAGGTADIFVGTSPENHPIIVRRLRSKYMLNFFKRCEFTRGLKIQGRMNHPNIVKLVDLVAFDTVPYGVMEYVYGVNLRQAMLTKSRLLADPIPIFRQLLEGLCHIHRQGYLHLDFKPENIQLSEEGHVKILDFDLAKQILKEARPCSQIDGTPAYLAPEQILKLPVDERADIFALGITAFELFTGHKPFMAQTREDVFAFYSNLGLPFPSARKVNPAIPPQLDQIIARCLEKKAERRYPTVSMILRDLNDGGLLEGS